MKLCAQRRSRRTCCGRKVVDPGAGSPQATAQEYLRADRQVCLACAHRHCRAAAPAAGTAVVAGRVADVVADVRDTKGLQWKMETKSRYWAMSNDLREYGR